LAARCPSFTIYPQKVDSESPVEWETGYHSIQGVLRSGNTASKKETVAKKLKDNLSLNFAEFAETRALAERDDERDAFDADAKLQGSPNVLT
jgi:hypothetical protein